MKNRSDVKRFWRSGDSTSKRVLDVLFFLSETVEDYSTVSCSSQVVSFLNAGDSNGTAVKNLRQILNFSSFLKLKEIWTNV